MPFILPAMSKLLPSMQNCTRRLLREHRQVSTAVLFQQQQCVHHLKQPTSSVNVPASNRISVIQAVHQTCKSHFSNSAHEQHPIVLVNDDRVTGVRRVTLNHPKKRNALSLAMIEQLAQHLQDPDGKLRAIVIDANGGKVFSSGHDLKELATLTADQSQHLFEQFSGMMLAIRNSPVPVICQVDGLAAAAGCQLVASCDIILATEGSHFSTPGADVGIFCSTPGIAVSRSANPKMAAYMVLTGRNITAQEALAAGLITRVVPDSQLASETDAILQSILAKSRSVIALGKKFFYKQIELDLPTAYSQGNCIMVKNLKLKDGQEGIDAFIHKRKAHWSHSSE